MRPDELTIVVAEGSEACHDLSIQGDHVNPGSLRWMLVASVHQVDETIGPHAYGPRPPKGRIPPFPKKPSGRIEDLHSSVSAIRHVQATHGIDGNAVGEVELAWPSALLAPLPDVAPLGRKLHYSVIAVAVGHVDRSICGNGYVGWPIEMAGIRAGDSTRSEREQ